MIDHMRNLSLLEIQEIAAKRAVKEKFKWYHPTRYYILYLIWRVKL